MATEKAEKIRCRVEWSDKGMKGKIPLNYNARPRREFISGREYDLEKGEIECLQQKELVSAEDQEFVGKKDTPEALGPDGFVFSERSRVNVIPLDKLDKRVAIENSNLRNENLSLKKRLEAVEGKPKAKVGVKNEVPDERGDNNESTV